MAGDKKTASEWCESFVGDVRDARTFADAFNSVEYIRSIVLGEHGDCSEEVALGAVMACRTMIEDCIGIVSKFAEKHPDQGPLLEYQLQTEPLHILMFGLKNAHESVRALCKTVLGGAGLGGVLNLDQSPRSSR